MRQVVRCFLLNENKILLVKHNKNTKWSLPGGHVEAGETIYEAMHREIKEEFNLEIEILKDSKKLAYENIDELAKPISIYTIDYTSPKHGDITKLEFIFVAKMISGDLKKQDEEIHDYRWFTKEEILKESSEIYPQIIDLLNLF